MGKLESVVAGVIVDGVSTEETSRNVAGGSEEEAKSRESDQES